MQTLHTSALRPCVATATQRVASQTSRATVQRVAHVQARASGTASSSSTADAATQQTAQPTTTDYFATDKRPVILFDGVCNMCNGGVNFVLDWDKTGVYRLAALQSNPGRQLLVRCGRQPDDISSIVLVEEDACYIKSDAVLRIATKLGMPLPLLAAAFVSVPKLIRDPLYDQVAANRYNIFGRTNACRVSSDGFDDRFLGA